MSYDFKTLNDQAATLTPYPGGSRDLVGQTQPVQPEVIQGESYYTPPVVGVRTEVPEECIPRTLTLSGSNPFLSILPRDMRRAQAVIIATTNPVYLAENKDIASQLGALALTGSTAVTNIGGFIPANVAVTLNNTDALYAAVSTTASTSYVTVIVQRFADDLT